MTTFGSASMGSHTGHAPATMSPWFVLTLVSFAEVWMSGLGAMLSAAVSVVGGGAPHVARYRSYFI